MPPVAQPDRFQELDVLRGLALFGVLLVNLLTLFRVSLFANIMDLDVPAGDTSGQAVMAVVAALLEFKAFTLFSLLFGAGVALQLGRGTSSTTLVRRHLILLAIGVSHLVFVWNGDILTLYAVCGLLLIPLLRLPAAAVACLAVALIVFSPFLPLPVHLPGNDAMRAQTELATRVYSQGSYFEIFQFRWDETRTFIGPLLVLIFPRTLGVMLLGAWFWRAGFLRPPNRRLWLWTLALGGTAAVAGTLLHIDQLTIVPLALAYAAAVLLWLPKASWLAAGGQMALTNYLSQSIIFSFVFYGYGFGLFGEVSVVAAAAGGIACYVAQLAFSRWWLERFRFGPAEWLWRSGTYGRLQPMRR